jgi:peroxiredoxin
MFQARLLLSKPCKRETRMLRAMLCCAVITLSMPALAIEGIETGKTPPAFSLPDIGGGTVALEDLRGRTAVLLFWSTWSPRSVEMLEDFKGYHVLYGSDDLRIVAINADHEHLTGKNRASIKRFVSRLELPFSVLLDVGLESYAAYGLEALPSAVVLDPEGKVSYSLGGYPLFSYREELRDAFLQAMGSAPEGEDLQVASAAKPEAASDPKPASALPRSR